MNIIKFAFLTIVSTLSSFAGVQTSLNALHETKTGIDFYGNSSVYFSTSKLVSISKQIYNVNGVVVSEIVLDLESSPSQIKIYNMQLSSIKSVSNKVAQSIKTDITSTSFNRDIAENMLNKATSVAEDKVNINKSIQLSHDVNKIYPSSTHSKTIEFAISKKEDINSLYDEIKNLYTNKTSQCKLNGTLLKITK